MKKSKAVKLGLLHGVILSAAACSQPAIGVDPCNTQTFNPPACQQALAYHGYYYQGQFFPMLYNYPYTYYYGGYNNYVLRGGRVYSSPASNYQRSYAPVDTRAQRFTGAMTRNGSYLSSSRMGSFSAGRSGATFSRGGFGSIGAGRGGSFGG